MTLIELVVGMVIVGLVLAAGTAAFGSVLDQRERATDALATASRQAALRRTIVSWIRGARLTIEEGGPAFVGLDGVSNGHPDDELQFLTTAEAGLEGDAIVLLHIDRDPRTPGTGLVADLTEWRGPGRDRVELAPAATGLEIRYLAPTVGKRQWLHGWISSSVLPLGVEVRVEAASPDSLPPLLRLPIHVTVGGIR